MAAPSPAMRPLSASAILIVAVLCFSWGFNHVAAKLALPDIPLFMQAALRSCGGLVVLMPWVWWRRVPIFNNDNTLRAGLIAGVLFGLEFIFIYRGLLWTSATRAVMFLYTSPFFVALGARFLLGERLSRLQWTGLALSFVGVACAMGVPQPFVTRDVMIGDAMLLIGGILWAATTLVVKASSLATASAEKTLAYQLAVSTPILAGASWFAGERMMAMPGTIAAISLAFQAFWVVGVTFTVWFALMRVYSASRLSSFTFLTPLFGVAAGYFVLNEPVSATFLLAAALVVAGLVLVNYPVKKA